MADFTASDAAEVLLVLRKKLIRIFGIVAATWAVVFTFVADPLITKLMNDMLPKGAEVIYTAPLEGLILKLKISLNFGLVIAIPYILYLSYRTLKERTAILNNVTLTKGMAIRYAIASVALFTVGVAYGYLIMLPVFMRFLYQTAVSQGVLAFYSISEFINFIVLMLTVFGLVFQMPLIMLFLIGNNVVEYNTLKYYRRHLYIGFFVIGAAITPPDVFTQLMIAFPMILFFEISLLLVRIVYRGKIKKIKKASST
jgi:sec-independent protein translocase protein TatC